MQHLDLTSRVKFYITIGLLLFVCTNIHAQISVDSIFKERHVSGSTTIYDLSNDKWFYSDKVDAHLPMQPASTFKIINTLVGLQTGEIENGSSIISWPGTTDTLKYGYRPDIYHDITIDEAFKVSAGWAYVEMAKNISRATYRKFLSENRYGNLNLSADDADFWNFGPMKISPKNQVEFLIKLYLDKTNFSKEHTDILKKIMISAQDNGTTLSSKTGWTRTEGKHIGWWVGYYEQGGNVYFFATRITCPLDKPVANFASLRKEITRDLFLQKFAIDLPID